jgi:hypothetical protein
VRDRSGIPQSTHSPAWPGCPRERPAPEKAATGAGPTRGGAGSERGCMGMPTLCRQKLLRPTLGFSGAPGVRIRTERPGALRGHIPRRPAPPRAMGTQAGHHRKICGEVLTRLLLFLNRLSSDPRGRFARPAPKHSVRSTEVGQIQERGRKGCCGHPPAAPRCMRRARCLREISENLSSPLVRFGQRTR